MKKFILDVILQRDTKIDLDHQEDVTPEEHKYVVDSIDKFLKEKFAKKFKYRMINRSYIKDFEEFMVTELNKLGKVVYYEQIDSNRICFAVEIENFKN